MLPAAGFEFEDDLGLCQWQARMGALVADLVDVRPAGCDAGDEPLQLTRFY
jgi:hypothetical protein